MIGTRVSGMVTPESTIAATDSEQKILPIVGIAGSNDPVLTKPAPIDTILTTDQVREVVWLALDRDTSPRNLHSQVGKDSWVVVKPNLVTCPVTMNDFHADGLEHWWLVTDLRVVKAIVEYLVEKIGPRRITIAEGPIWYSSGGKLKKEKFVDGWHCKWTEFGNLSYADVVDDINVSQSRTKVDIVDLNEDDSVHITDFDPHNTGLGTFQDVEPGTSEGSSDTEWTKRKGFQLPKTIMDCDVLITVPVLKTHSSAGVTLCMKNFVGCIHGQTYGHGNSKKEIHQGSQLGLVRGIADLACAINPDYAVAEGFWATIQQHLGQNGVRFNHNVVIAGGDVVAAEAVCMMLMGYNPLDSDLLRMLHREKMGQWHPDNISIKGPPVQSLSRNYIRAANTYFARGIRTWLFVGPVRTPLKKPEGLKPNPGDSVDKTKWDVLDGDAIIDAGINISKPSKLQECLLFSLPESDSAKKGNLYYLVQRVITQRKDLCGQLLVGLDGGDFRCFFNGREVNYPKDAAMYDPTPMPFLKFREGENILVLEVKKLNGRKDPVRFAANLCDLDGDRLGGIMLYPNTGSEVDL